MLRPPSWLCLLLILAGLGAQETDGDALRDAQMLAGVLRSAPTGIGTVEHRVITQVNDYILRLTGYQREQLLGQSARMLYPSQEDFDYVGREKYRQISRHGTGSVETRWQHQDGSIRHVILSSTPLDPDDLAAGVVFTVMDITKRRQAEERFQTVFDVSPAALVLSDLETGRIIDLNRATTAMLGYHREDLIGHSTVERGIWPDPQERTKALAKLAAQGQLDAEPVQLRHKNGQLHWLRLSAASIDRQGRPTMLSVLLDETQQRRAEASLGSRTRWFLITLGIAVLLLLGLTLRLGLSLRQQQQTKAELERYFSSSLDLLCIADTDGRFLRLNPEWERVLGYSLADLEQQRFLDLVHPDDREATLAATATLASGQPVHNFTNRYRCRDGSYRWIEWRSQAQGNLIYAVARDITDRRRIEDENTYRRQILDSLLDNLPIGVFMVRVGSGEPVVANPKAKELLGRGILPEVNQDNLGQIYQSFITGTTTPYPTERMPIIRGMHGERSHVDDMTVVRPDGSSIQLEVYGTPVVDSQGTVILSLTSFFDVTERRMAEEQLRQSQKMEAIGQLAGGVAHDFNNMLCGILGATELLVSRPDVSPRQRRHLDLIASSANRAADLTRKLLSFARRQPLANQAIDLHQAVQAAIDLLSPTLDRRITIDTALVAEQSTVMGDATLLQNVFLNLGINAAHAMPEGGNLSFSSRTIPGTDLPPGILREASTTAIEINVRDSGNGIAAEHLPHIFEPFFTTKGAGRGSGLGLASALGTIQQHGGSITVDSSPGSGTCFHILLPLTSGEAALRPPVPQEHCVPGSGCILLVDDEAVMRDCGTALLEEAGYRVLVAADGEEALACYTAHRAEIDLVLLDMVMPRLNGRDCFHALRQLRPDLPIILASGFSHEDELADLRSHGLAGFLAKPYSGPQLTHMLSEALAGTPSPPEHQKDS